MNKITATGILYGQKVKITVAKGEENLEFSINDKELLDAARMRFDYCQESIEPIYGCFLFPKNTLASAKMALENRFFDNENYRIVLNGELEKIPYEEGWLY